MERLSGLDASFLYLESPTLHLHVAFTAVLDPSTMPGGYSFTRITEHISSRIPAAPVFRRRLVEVPFGLGHPVWADDPEFRIDNHLHRAAIPAPGGASELAEFVADVVGRKLDRDRPLWEMWAVEGLMDNKVAIVAKMHHCTIDGISGAELLGVLLDLAPAPVGTPPTSQGELRPPSLVELVGDTLIRRGRNPVEMLRTACRTATSVAGVHRVRHTGPGRAALPLTAPRVSLNAAIGSGRRVAFAAVSLEEVKALKDACGVTVNDVVLTLATGALRDYLLAGDELPSTPLVAVVPVSVRPEEASLPGSNRVSAMFVALPTHLHSPVDRLAFIRQCTKGAKQEHLALGADTLQNWAEHASPNLFGVAARLYTRMRLAEHHRPIANLVISNVPGPNFPLYLAGARLEATFPLGPVMDGMGLNITIMSYQGALYWGLVSCSRTVGRLEGIADSIPLELQQLASQVGVASRSFDAPLGLASGDQTKGAGPRRRQTSVPANGGTRRRGGPTGAGRPPASATPEDTGPFKAPRLSGARPAAAPPSNPPARNRSRG